MANPFQTQQIDYGTWMSNNPQAQGIVTEDIYNKALGTFGYMPAGTLAPNGSMFWNSSIATPLGLPTGTKLSTMGTSYGQAATPGDPYSGSGSIFVPQEVQDAAKRQGYSGPGSAQVIGDYYQNAGVMPAMGSQNPMDYGYGNLVPNTNSPMRSRTYAGIDNAAAGTPSNPTGTANQGAVNDFMSWFNNQGPRAEGALGAELNFPQARTFDNQYGNWAVMPGQIGTTYDANLMQSNPGIFASQIQSQQLLQGDPLYGDKLHGFVPPWVAASAGLGGSNYLMGDWPAAPSLYDDNGVPHGIDPNVPPAVLPGGGFGPGNGSGSGSGGANPNPFPPVGGGGGNGGGSTGGGGSTPSLPGQPAAPTYPNPTVNDPTGGVSTDSFFPSNGPSSADQWLAQGGTDISYLQGFAQDGQAINALPAWDAMRQAQERNLDRRYADLMESFNVSGNRVSSPFGQAAVDFQNQAGLEQNALLAQMTQQALEAAMGRQFGAAGQLGQMAQQGISQLSGQDFQSDMWQMQHAYDMAQQMYQGSVTGAQSMADNAMKAATAMYGAETAAGMSEADRQLALQQMMMGAAGNLSNIWMQNLGLGSALGQQQYGIGQNEIDRIYQEWLRTRNYNSPILPYLYAGATGYPLMAYPQQQQSAWPSILGMMGGPLSQILGGLGNGGNSTTNLSGYFGGITG